jgi:hypothetical protein
MKRIILALTILATAFAATAQTNIPPANTNLSVGQNLSLALQTLVSSTNMLWEAHATYTPSLAQHVGGGVGGYYLLSQTGSGTVTLDTYTGLRIDWVDGGFWMPQGNVGLQTPITVFSNLVVTPFTYAGIGVPLSGASIGGISIGGSVKDNDGQATAIIGAGGAISFLSLDKGKWNAGILADVEKWSGFSGNQFRFGLFARKNF